MAALIDRLALGGVCSLAYYLFFLNAWGSIPLACGAAFAGTMLTGVLVRGRRPGPRTSFAQVRSELLRIASLDEREAEAVLTDAIRQRWPKESFRLVPALKHPEATLSPGDILNAWKANRDAGRLVIAATCPCEPRAALYADTLSEPAVAVVDSRRLARLLRAMPVDRLPPAAYPSPREALRRLRAHIGATRPSVRSCLLAAGMLAYYLFSGNAWYLFPSLALLAHAGIGLFHRGRGRSLFDSL